MFSPLLRPRCGPRAAQTFRARGERRRGSVEEPERVLTWMWQRSRRRHWHGQRRDCSSIKSGWRYAACRPATHREEAEDCGSPITRTACPGNWIAMSMCVPARAKVRAAECAPIVWTERPFLPEELISQPRTLKAALAAW